MRVAAFALVFLLASPLAAGASEAVRKTVDLPGEHWRAAGASDGTYLYLFGGSPRDNGQDPSTSDILRYDPRTDALAMMEAKLPRARSSAVAVWDGTEFLIFGGVEHGAGRLVELDDIVAYDPAKDTARSLDARLPSTLYGAAGAWLAGSAYLFGGVCEKQGIGILCDDIIRFDGQEATYVKARLPEPLSSPGIATDGERIWLFGGANTQRGGHNDIRVWSPDLEQVATTDDTLPGAQWDSTVAWTGAEFVIAGGHAYAPVCDAGPPSCTANVMLYKERDLRRVPIEVPVGVDDGQAGAWLDDVLVVATEATIYEVDPYWTPPKEAPGPGPFALMAILGVAALVQRRR